MLLLHGYADCAASFQFVADEIAPGLPLLAMDWRGFGRSARSAGGYWFPDYYADLEACSIDRLCPRSPARIVGHSMGANVAMIYAGVRPARVRATGESRGLRPAAHVSATGADAARTRGSTSCGNAGIRRIREPRRARRPRREAQPAAARPNGRPSSPHAGAKPLAGGGVRLLADPAHRRTNPYLYRREEIEACWRAIEARVLLVVGADSELLRGSSPRAAWSPSGRWSRTSPSNGGRRGTYASS